LTLFSFLYKLFQSGGARKLCYFTLLSQPFCGILIYFYRLSDSERQES
jgi:hypothetical protein